MLKMLFFLIVLFVPNSVFGQVDSLLFNNLFNHFHENNYNRFGQKLDSVSWSTLYKTKDFNVTISKSPIYFETDQRLIKNPFFTDEFDDYVNYPVSYSTIYDNKLISLFRNGKFVVHDLEGYSRDTKFEDSLNSKKFSYHWVIDGKLYARRKNWIFSRLMVWSKGKWEKADINLPVENRPILFDDEKFIVFNDCFGEWGGTVYFYDRETENTYFTESRCSNSVYIEEGGYTVLAHLGHMIGSSEVKSIEEPNKLTEVKKGETLGYTDEYNGYEKSLDLNGIQLFSTFPFNERQVYLTHLNELSFLSEIQDSVIQIVHPLFDNDLYTHEPITKIYGNYTLINLDHWRTARDREVSVIIIEQNKITKLDWNERHFE